MVIVHYGDMKHHQQRYNRRSIRLRNHDYAKPGAYFVTIIAQDRSSLFGTIKDGTVHLNDAGTMVLKWYFELEKKFSCVKCDVVVCMPDHIHFLIFIIDNSSGDQHDMHSGDHVGSPLLGDIVGWFKTMTTNEYIRGVKESNWPAFNRRLWQRNYYDHIIRTAKSLNNIRQYIHDNPRMGDPTWSPITPLCDHPF
jgi:REP element-mobilizing transposase RayT